MAKKLFTLFMLLTLFFGIGWAATETVTVTKTMNEVVAENDYITPFSGYDDFNDLYQNASSMSQETLNEIELELQKASPSMFFLADNISILRQQTLDPPALFWETSPIEWQVYCSVSENMIGYFDISVPSMCTLQSVTITYSDASTGVLTYNGNDVPSGTPCAVSGNKARFEVRGTTEEILFNYVGITSISVTYEKRDIVKGEWHQVRSTYNLGLAHYEYIILDREKTKVAGSYENGHFTALPCESNVEFCDDDIWGNGTLNLTGDGVKRFTIEDTGSSYYYLKDTEGNYYSIDENGNIVNSKQKVYIVSYYSHNNPTGRIRISGVYPNDVNKIFYNPDESYFGTYYSNTTNYIGDLEMYRRPKPMTLKEIREYRKDGYYVISNELQVAKSLARFSPTENFAVAAMVCKDDGPAWDATDMSAIPDNCEDYMTTRVGFNGNWDQSNWALLDFSRSLNGLSDLERIKACEGMRLAPNSITVKAEFSIAGSMSCAADVNDLVTVEGSQPTTYTPNRYCPANFLKSNHNGNATGHDAEGNPTENHYFFMNPKMQELCEIVYAVWAIPEDQAGEKHGYFVLPASDGTNNPEGIYGEVCTNWSLNNAPVIDPETGEKHDWPDGLVEGTMYRFYGVVMGPTIYSDVDPVLLRADSNYGYTIYPIDFDPVEHIVTGIKDVVDVTDKTVAGVKYYNLAGIESDRPFEGVNIIVTTYTDGSRSSSKVLK